MASFNVSILFKTPPLLFQKKLTKDASHFDKKIIEKLPFGEIPWKNRYFSSPLATEKLC
jgi:hypothetical protein